MFNSYWMLIQLLDSSEIPSCLVLKLIFKTGFVLELLFWGSNLQTVRSSRIRIELLFGGVIIEYGSLFKKTPDYYVYCMFLYFYAYYTPKMLM